MGQDRLGLLVGDLSLHGRRVGIRIVSIGRPAVINPLAPLAVEAVQDPGGGAPTFERRGEQAVIGQQYTVYLYSTKCRLPSTNPVSYEAGPSSKFEVVAFKNARFPLLKRLALSGLRMASRKADDKW